MKPNIVLVLADDMGYSDLACYGGEVDTPNLNALAEGGLRFTNFYNTARCSPSRASLLTGLHPHQTDVGLLVADHSPEGYAGSLNHRCVTMAEVLQNNGYSTYISGKWHLCHDVENKNDAWPSERGFDNVYSMLCGANTYFYPKHMVRGDKNIDEEIRDDDDFYLTDAISDQASDFIDKHCSGDHDEPFFLYVAYNAPHWPLHAKPTDIEKYHGKFNDGWDELRQRRIARMKKIGLIADDAELTPRDPKCKAWAKVKNKEWELRRMGVYAAMIDSMDQGIGRIVDTLKRNAVYDNTLFIFLSDNGGCAEHLAPVGPLKMLMSSSARAMTKHGEKVKYGNSKRIMPGSPETFQSYGQSWANLSNAPFRLYKHWTHEGGIATPLIIHWPNQLEQTGRICRDIAQLPDIMATIVEITGSEYPDTYNGHKIHPLEGTSLAPIFKGESNGKEYMFFEHEGNACVRTAKWKLVRDFPLDWELYNIKKDPTELRNVIDEYPEIAADLQNRYRDWAKRVGVVNFYDVMQYEIRNQVGFLPKFIRKPAARFIARHFFSHKKWYKLIQGRKRRNKD